MNQRINDAIYQLDNAKFENLINITFGDLLDAQAERFPDVECVIDNDLGVRFTYSQFRDECNTIAKGFLAMGIKKGDHVAIWATNCAQWLTTMFATAKIGAVMVTVNTNYKRFELEYLMRQSDATTLIMIDGFKDSDYVEHLTQIVPDLAKHEKGKLNTKKLPYLKNVISLNNEHDGMFNWSDLYELSKNISDDELSAIQMSLDVHDTINMQYTSGTTGFPKGVMLSHHSVVNNGKSIGDRMKFSEKDRLLIVVPLFHCFGCVLAVTACMTHASTMIIVDRFHPEKVMKQIEKEKCTAFHGVPTMFISILNHPYFAQCDFSTLRTGIMAGSPCPIEVMKKVNIEMHMPEIVISFGMTESSPVTTMTSTDDPMDKRVSTVGRVQPNVEVRIVNPETGEDVQMGETGEFITRGYQVMKGYYKMPEATRQAIDAHGWLHTGDLASIDQDGYFRITGRLKDMIIRGGENIYPREIEEFLYQHPDVNDVQVVGVPDEKYGEEVLAYLILNEGAHADEEGFIQYVKNGLSRYKAPRYVKFIDAFPMTASGKIQKFVLREMGVKILNLENADKIETA